MMRMHWFLLALIVLLTLALPASAQTTFPGPVCGSSFSISGGTNVSVLTGSNAENCIANVPKSSGKWYFTSTSSSFGWTNAVGIANAGLPTNGYDSGGGQLLGSGANSVGFRINRDGAPQNIGQSHNAGVTPTTTTATVTPVSGATQGIAVDLESLPHQFWVTPDITGTSGCGGGPLWNGDVNSAPLVRGGCGGPGTGLKFWMGIIPVYPAITGQNFSGQQTVASFGFDNNSTLDSLIGGGGNFLSWNTAGGGFVDRSLSSPEANAPAWSTNHTVVAGDRMTAGPGWTAGSPGSFTDGLPIYLWAVSGAGGTTASSGNGPQSCPSPAGYGSGFSGSTPSAWAGATTVNDNGINWVCLTKLDHVTFHDANLDSPPWQAGHLYAYAEFAKSNRHIFLEQDGHTTTGHCTSGSTPPPPGGGSDGNCTWADIGTITYSPNTNYLLHITSPFPNTAELTMNELGVNNIIVWYGGLESQTYSAGIGGEDSPIQVRSHTDNTSVGIEAAFYCPDSFSDQSVGCGFEQYKPPAVWFIFFKVLTAPGDSAGETAQATGGAIGPPDSTKGVMFSTTSSNSSVNTGFSIYDRFVDFEGFQVYSQFGVGLGGQEGGGGTMSIGGQGDSWGGLFNNLIVQGGGNAAIVHGNGGIYNTLVKYTGTVPYGTAIWSRFPSDIVNDIIIGPGTCSTSSSPCYPLSYVKVSYPGTPYSRVENTWTSGFSDPLIYIPAHGDFGGIIGSNNATDISSAYVPIINSSDPFISDPAGFGYGSTFQLPGSDGVSCGGSCQGLTASSQFVSLGTDFRLNSGSNLIAAGSDALSVTFSTDLLGNPRPTSGRYDIGVAQYTGSAPTPAIASVSLAGDGTFAPGVSATVGDLTTILSSGTFSGAYGIQTTGTDHSGATCNNYGSSFALSGSALTTTGPALGSYPGVCILVTQAGASNSPYVQAFNLTSTSSPLTITSLNLSGTTFPSGGQATIGTLSTTFSTGSFPVSYTVQTTGVDHSGTSCVNYGNAFNITLGADLVSTQPGTADGTYPGFCVKADAGTGVNNPFVQAFTLVGGVTPPLAITSVNLSASTFVPGSSSTVGNLTTVLNTGSFSGTDTLVTSGTDHSGTTCNNYGGDFAISGASPSYQLTTTGPIAGSYPGVCVSTDQSGASNTPYVQAFTITGISPPSITAVNLSNAGFVVGSSSTVGSLSTTLSSGSFSGSYTIQITGTDHSGATCINYSSDFSISGSDLTTIGPAAGSYPGVCVAATQAGASNSPYVQAFTLTGSSTPPPAPVITSATSATGTVGISFSYQITATNSPTSFNATGLPSPLVVNTSTGFITGTPSGPSTTDVPISATNAGGTGSASLHLVISGTSLTTSGGLRRLDRW